LLAKANKQTLHANTEVARTMRKLKSLPPATLPCLHKFQTERDGKKPCPTLADIKSPTAQPAVGCRGGLGGNVVKNLIFFGENFAKQNSLERAN
jgi:hypothetical protein